jgi:predicted ABC-type transport system involved in lysophospholipase L1 biosynthesis ATPase subunit
MSIVEVRHASMILGADENRHAAFEDTSFEVEAGAFLCIVGSSGAPIDQRGERGTRNRNDRYSYQGG